MSSAIRNKDYFKLLDNLYYNGHSSGDRTGTGTKKLFGGQMVFDLSDGFLPILEEKKVSFNNVLSELLFFLKGHSNITDLHKYNNHIWDEWADENGDLGPIYGVQWRNWTAYIRIDQLGNVISELKSNPNSRRLVVSAWNPSILPDLDLSPSENAFAGLMCLAPCHMSFQFWTREISENNFELSLRVDQRSMDMFLGAPYNIASYGILLHLVAKMVKMKVGKLIFQVGDYHIYNNHSEQVVEILNRYAKKFVGISDYSEKFPKLEILADKSAIEDYEMEDFKLVDYFPDSAILAEISI